MRTPLGAIDGRAFDVAIVGAGINGAATAEHLSAAGYRVLLVDRGDFASGASGRSSRMLHCGLRYLAPGTSMMDLLRHPRRLLAGAAMAREALRARTDFVTTRPDRVRRVDCFMPLYHDGAYAGWQVDLAFRTLAVLNGSGGVPLDYRRFGAAEAARHPLLGALCDPGRLAGVAAFREYRYDWPERIAVDAALEAARLGATVRNHTGVEALKRDSDGLWQLTLDDRLEPATARITARIVLNMTGVSVDRLNRRIGGAAALPSRKVTGMKGTHVLLRLPLGCADQALMTVTRAGKPFFCMPASGGLHCLGLTDSRDEGEPDDAIPTPDEIAFLIAEAADLLPGLGLGLGDVVAAYSGICPYTYSPDVPNGKRTRDLHDLGAEGLPNLFALTGGSIRTHRLVAAEVVERVGRIIPPSGPHLREQPSPILADGIERAVIQEQAATLEDVMFRRLGFGWSAIDDPDLPDQVATSMAERLGWTPARRATELDAYRTLLHRQFALPSVGDALGTRIANRRGWA